MRAPKPAVRRRKWRKPFDKYVRRLEQHTVPLLAAHSSVRLEQQRVSLPTLLSFVITMSRPKHPTSAYNLFFQYERYRLLENLTSSDAPVAAPKIDPGIDEDEDEYAARRRYTVITAADVDKAQKYSAERAKRKLERESAHSSSGGADSAAPKASLGFADLARTIAARWKTLDESNKAVFEELSWIDKSRYQVQLYVWRRDRATREAEQQSVLQDHKRQKMNPPSASELSSHGEKAPLLDSRKSMTALAAALDSDTAKTATLRELYAKHAASANSIGC
jgi:hypothetical protein